jgi:undecaprenyl-diphosphatase
MALYFIDRKWFKYFLIFAILMGVARVFVGVHYPSDVFIGAIIGLGTGLLVYRLYGYTNKI